MLDCFIRCDGFLSFLILHTQSFGFFPADFFHGLYFFAHCLAVFSSLILPHYVCCIYLIRRKRNHIGLGFIPRWCIHRFISSVFRIYGGGWMMAQHYNSGILFRPGMYSTTFFPSQCIQDRMIQPTLTPRPRRHIFLEEACVWGFASAHTLIHKHPPPAAPIPHPRSLRRGAHDGDGVHSLRGPVRGRLHRRQLHPHPRQPRPPAPPRPLRSAPSDRKGPGSNIGIGRDLS